MGENVKHFSLEEKDDNTYGWPWNEVVKTFLQSHYNCLLYTSDAADD